MAGFRPRTLIREAAIIEVVGLPDMGLELLGGRQLIAMHATAAGLPLQRFKIRLSVKATRVVKVLCCKGSQLLLLKNGGKC